MTAAGERRRIAIACQGGGSHTAFTAGVLTRLLGDRGSRERHEIVGLSGTSGGAICALLAWYGLASDDPDRPGILLDAFWADNSATAPFEQALNSWTLWAGALQDVVAMPAVSPYANPFADAAPAELRRLLTRHVDFDALPTGPAHPMLLVGAVDVGNLSLHQELHFIEKIDQLLEEGALARDGRYRTIVLRIIELSRSALPGGLGPTSSASCASTSPAGRRSTSLASRSRASGSRGRPAGARPARPRRCGARSRSSSTVAGSRRCG